MIRKLFSPLYPSSLVGILLLILFTSQATYASNISEEIKSYIRNIKSIAVEFSQTDTNGNKAEGMLVINKPYKFRCNYYKPFPLLIVGNKNYVSVYDYEMENLSRIKAVENIFYFLLVDDIKFDKKFSVESAREEGGKYILKLHNKELNKSSEIIFDKQTKNIIKLTIFEENNVITLLFKDTKKIAKVKNSLFLLQDPDVFGAPKRMEANVLKKALGI